MHDLNGFFFKSVYFTCMFLPFCIILKLKLFIILPTTFYTETTLNWSIVHMSCKCQAVYLSKQQPAVLSRIPRKSGGTMRQRRAGVEGFGVGCVRRVRGLDYCASLQAPIDLIQTYWNGCFPRRLVLLCKELVEQEVIYWLFPLDGLTSLKCLDLLHFILYSTQCNTGRHD